MNADVKNVHTGSREQLSAYVDEIIFYVNNPAIMLTILMSELRQFGYLSNFRINVPKSEILPVIIPPTWWSD